MRFKLKYFYTFIAIYFCIYSYAQNLVPNPSFELHSSCPNASGQINFVNFWTAPGTSNTPDYFDACATNIGVSVPYRSIYDYQNASSGNAYVGIWTYSTLGFIREIIQTQLNQTLTLNNYYYFKMKVNLHNYARFAINNIGAIISTNTTVPLYNSAIGSTPVLHKYGNPIIMDTLIWTNIEAIYKASGGEQYISISNFLNDNYTDTLSVSPQYPYSYYFIDDVSVEPICTPFWTYRDTTLAIGQDSVLIGPAITGLNINWYDATNTFITNAPGIYVKPAQTTTYTAVEDFCGTTYTNTIVVTVQPTGINDISYLNEVVGVSPNPTNNIITITSRFDFEKVDLLSITGQVLIHENVNSNNLTLSTDNLSNGIYFVKVTYPNGLSTVKKVIKQ